MSYYIISYYIIYYSTGALGASGGGGVAQGQTVESRMPVSTQTVESSGRLSSRA